MLEIFQGWPAPPSAEVAQRRCAEGIPLPDIPLPDCVYGFTEEDRICGDVTGSPEKPEVQGIRQRVSYTEIDIG